jgi:hypothetical protein
MVLLGLRATPALVLISQSSSMNNKMPEADATKINIQRNLTQRRTEAKAQNSIS